MESELQTEWRRIAKQCDVLRNEQREAGQFSARSAEIEFELRRLHKHIAEIAETGVQFDPHAEMAQGPALTMLLANDSRAQVPCPHCGAGIGRQCRDPRGYIVPMHKKRGPQ